MVQWYILQHVFEVLYDNVTLIFIYEFRQKGFNLTCVTDTLFVYRLTDRNRVTAQVPPSTGGSIKAGARVSAH